MTSKPWLIPAPSYRRLDAVWDTEADDPGLRCAHTLTAVAPTKSLGPRLILFGGATAIEGGASSGIPGIRLAGVTNTVHSFDVETRKWISIQPAGDPPSPRAAHAAAAVGTMVVFQGGIGPAGHSTDDLYVLDMTNDKFKWHRLVVQGAGPGPRYGHAMDLVNQRYLVTVSGNDAMHFPMSISNIELLNGLNYKKWKGDIELNLGILDFDHVLREDPPPEPAANACKEVKDKYNLWQRHNKMALICMKKSMTDAVKGGIPDNDNARVYYNSIALKYKESDKAETGILMNKLIKMRFNGQGSIREYIMQGIDTAGKLKGLNITVEDSFLVYLVLNSLPEAYGYLKSLYNTQKQVWSLDELISICVQEETEVLKKGKGVSINYMGNPVHYRPQPKKNFGKFYKGSSSKNPMKSDVVTKGKSVNHPGHVKCFFCKKVGHYKKDCDGFKNWLKKKGIIKNNNPKQE